MAARIAVIAPGMMGAGVGARLSSRGAEVLTLLQGRSPATVARAEKAGMRGADETAVAACDIILSIVPPGDASAVAERLAPALDAAARKPFYVDCNAVNPDTAERIDAIIAAAGAPFVDGGIMGGPPREGYAGPAIYLSGPRARELQTLNDHGLDCRVLDEVIGTASAMKMCYGGITKGITAVGATLMLAASRAGVADALRAELEASQPALMNYYSRGVPGMFSKAHRWVAEMEEISSFVGDRAEAGIHKSMAGLYERLAQDWDGERDEIDALAGFFARKTD